MGNGITESLSLRGLIVEVKEAATRHDDAELRDIAAELEARLLDTPIVEARRGATAGI